MNRVMTSRVKSVVKLFSETAIALLVSHIGSNATCKMCNNICNMMMFQEKKRHSRFHLVLPVCVTFICVRFNDSTNFASSGSAREKQVMLH